MMIRATLLATTFAILCLVGCGRQTATTTAANIEQSGSAVGKVGAQIEKESVAANERGETETAARLWDIAMALYSHGRTIAIQAGALKRSLNWTGYFDETPTYTADDAFLDPPAAEKQAEEVSKKLDDSTEAAKGTFDWLSGLVGGTTAGAFALGIFARLRKYKKALGSAVAFGRDMVKVAENVPGLGGVVEDIKSTANAWQKKHKVVQLITNELVELKQKEEPRA